MRCFSRESLEERQALCEGRHIWKDTKAPQLSTLTCAATEGTPKSSTSTTSHPPPPPLSSGRGMRKDCVCHLFKAGIEQLPCTMVRLSLWPTYPQNVHSGGNLRPATVVLWLMGMVSSSCISAGSLPGPSGLTLASVDSGTGVGWEGGGSS